ncbi:MAG: hypothetical protein R2781_00135 [Flavobacteriaceae bacterium]
MIFGEYAYNYVYSYGSYRNKTMWVRDADALQNEYDFVILGNSRAYYHLDPILITEKTGKQGLNLAINNSYPFEIKLMLQDFFKNSKADQAFIQVDYTYNVTQPDIQASVDWIPYIIEESLFRQFPKQQKEFIYYKSIPFYRYSKFESVLGFRNVLLSIVGKEPNFLLHNGFVSLQKRELDVKPFSFTLKNTANPHLKDIIDLVNEKGVELYFFTAPCYNSEGNFEVLSSQLPNYTNFSEAIEEEFLFSDAIHLNENGAIRFTEIFIDTYFEYKED